MLDGDGTQVGGMRKDEYAAKSTLEKAELLELFPAGTKQIGEPGFSFVEYGMEP